MVNIQWNPIHETPDSSERINITDIIELFKKSLTIKEDGYYPSFEEVQDGLKIFLIHMRAINSLHITFVQETLHEYNHSCMNAPEKDLFKGLQGYIHYIEKRIINPLLTVIELEEKTKGETIILVNNKEEQEYLIRKLSESIADRTATLLELKEIGKRIEYLLAFNPPTERRNLLIHEWEKCKKVLKEVESDLNKSKMILIRISGNKD